MREQLRNHAARPVKHPRAASSNGPVDAGKEGVIAEIQDLMWQDAGIVRAGPGLKRAIERLNQLAPRVAHPQTRRAFEAQNLHAVGLLVSRAALAREESRGAHYRTDFPLHNDARFLKHSIIQRDSIRFA